MYIRNLKTRKLAPGAELEYPETAVSQAIFFFFMFRFCWTQVDILLSYYVKVYIYIKISLNFNSVEEMRLLQIANSLYKCSDMIDF